MDEAGPGASPGPRPDRDIDAEFGFTAESREWLEQARRATQPVALGRLGTYELLSEIGRGGQGSVYRAVQPGTGRIVALKRLAGSRETGSHAAARFARETEAVTRLSHPNVVTVFGAEILDGHPALVMELVDGEPLDRWADRTRQSGEFTPLLRTFATVCDGVAHAHQRGVIHLDLKPANVLVTADGTARVVDFGVARLRTDAAPEALSTTTGFAGTPVYASPEQIEGRSRHIDTRSDVYSLGAILYRLITGADPFALTPNLPAMFESLRKGVRRPSQVSRNVPRELDWVVLKAMDTDPARRYQTVDALGADIRRSMRQLPVEAHPPSALYRLRKFIRRRRGVVLFALLAAACLAAAALFMSRAAIKTSTALAQARTALANEAIATSAANASAARATRAAAIETEVSRFLRDMLNAANPGERDGNPTITVREVLDRASQNLLANEAKYEPEVEAPVRQLIAETYMRLGLLAESETHLTRALELNRTLHGPESDQALRTLHFLGRLYRGSSLNRAEEIQREIVRIRRARGAPDIPYLAQALVSLGIGLRTAGKLAEAETAYLEALEIYRRLSETDENVGQVRSSLAVLYLKMNQLDDAEVQAREAVRVGAAVHGQRPHSDTAAYRYNLGQVLWTRGRHEDAEREIRAAIQTQIEALNEPSAAWQRFGLADRFIEQGRHSEAEALLRSVLQAAAAPTSPDARAAVERLARLYISLGKAAEAETLCAESIAGGGNRRDLRGVLTQLGRARTALGRFPQAREDLLEAWSFATGNPGPEHQSVARALVDLFEAWEHADPNRGHAAQADPYRPDAAAPSP